MGAERVDFGGKPYAGPRGARGGDVGGLAAIIQKTSWNQSIKNRSRCARVGILNTHQWVVTFGTLQFCSPVSDIEADGRINSKPPFKVTEEKKPFG